MSVVIENNLYKHCMADIHIYKESDSVISSKSTNQRFNTQDFRDPENIHTRTTSETQDTARNLILGK